ncbi:hypothetical protein DH2020_026650 [Rehmannia glutinosa]|uniref:GATA-type domain-containing protein n=1 Tax=Rehmannia glutinosa TaxID=99300 RepID=A0ABR0VWB5_REHGL
MNPSPFPTDHQINSFDHDQQHRQLIFAPDHQLFSSSSSSSASYHIFFNSTQHHTGSYYHRQIYQPHHQEDDDKYGHHGAGSSYEIKNMVNNGLKLSLDQGNYISENKDNSLKWMSSKMRLMQSMENPVYVAPKLISSATAKLEEDLKPQPSSSLETDISSNNCSYNSPIRVCSDCNTTKTPLWRSGPKGPKSLCNACGIRQRKARRAMAAAAASGTAAVATHQPPAMKIKMEHKEKKGKNGNSSSQLLKKHCKLISGTTGSSSDGGGRKKKIGLEDFLINLSNNLASQLRVFPEDEKDAAILLMALSSGLVHAST